MASTSPARQHADTVNRTLEEREKSQCGLEKWHHHCAQHGNQDEDSQQAVNNAGNRRQELNDKGQVVGNPRGGKLGKEDGGAHPQRHGHQKRQSRRNQRAINERQSAEIPADRVPGSSQEKFEPKFVAGHRGIDVELVDQHRRYDNNAGRRQQRDQVSDLIPVPQLLHKLPRAPGKARAVKR